jgi:hypothetical protein
MRVAYVTIAIGDAYIDEYKRIFQPSHIHYAKRHGYDYKLVTDYSGDIRSPALIALEKQLLCSQPWAANYDLLLYTDADVLIHPNAPPIHTLYDPATGAIGMIDEMNQPSRAERHALQVRMGWETSVPDYYALAGISFQTDRILNGGVILWNPKLHAEFCHGIYERHREQQLHHPRGMHYEQAAINYEYQRGAKVQILPSSWNAVWALHYMTTFKGTLEEFIGQNYFIHLAGHVDYALAEEWVRWRFKATDMECLVVAASAS